MHQLRKLLTDNRGVSAIEYALIASLISVAAIAGFYNLGGKVQSSYSDIEQNITTHL